ncbi:hypothetical protein ScPMuIL_000839 [Solemya velum]
MLTSVANYLFGYQAESDNAEAVDLKTSPSDQDWVMVEHPDKDCLVGESEPSEILVPLSSATSSDSASSSPRRPTPDSISPVGHSRYCFRSRIGTAESWILSPPPCFTAGNCEGSEVMMTPMENLLIEHPSMSVYKRKSHSNGGSTGEGSSDSDSSNQENSVLPCRSGLRLRSRKIVGQPPRQAHAVAARAGLLQNIQAIKASQRKHVQRETKRFTRSQLQRINVTSVVASLGRHQNKRTRKQCPSGCMNGRISQRSH